MVVKLMFPCLVPFIGTLRSVSVIDNTSWRIQVNLVNYEIYISMFSKVCGYCKGLHCAFKCALETQKSIIERPQRLFKTGKFKLFFLLFSMPESIITFLFFHVNIF